ncbi:hypothetical protein [Stakelama pacifica]|nr:hypothetical protein [Stakelama pacifica]
MDGETMHWEAEVEETEATRSPAGVGRIIAIAVIALSLIWLFSMTALCWPQLQAGMAPVALAEFIAALCIPPMLIGVIALLLLRTPRAEAARFGGAARAMRAEAASLDRIVTGLSQRIEQNRVELAEQTNALFTMGDDAAERLHAVSNGMSEQAKALDRSAAQLVETANRTGRSLEVVLASLPKAQEEAAGLKDRIDESGLAAGRNVSALDAQLSALTQRGREANDIAGGAAERLAAHIARMEATSEAAGARLEQVAEDMSGEVDAVLHRAAEAVDQSRQAIIAQSEALVAMLTANQEAMHRAGEEGAAALGGRIDAIETALARITERLGAEHQRSADLFASIDTAVNAADARIETLHGDSMDRTRDMVERIESLTRSANDMEETMRRGDYTAKSVIDTAEHLLTALDAAAREMDETMPQALARLDKRIDETQTHIAGAAPEVEALLRAAEGAQESVRSIATLIADQRDAVRAMNDTLLDLLDHGESRIANVHRSVETTIDSARRFSDEAAPQLVDTLLRIRETAATASDQARKTLGAIIPAAAHKLEQESSDALERAVDRSVNRQIAELHRSADEALGAANDAAERLSRQMSELSGATAEIEGRLKEALAERQANDRDALAHHVSLLIDALNSASIDISKHFSDEVSDTAWSAYLKGDRGIFTRRAVRLLDTPEAKAIARLYGEDDSFHELVNRYIHDFEAMLRQVLALRDGSPLGITMLSSDMGKLYVMLAQAIERLRG